MSIIDTKQMPSSSIVFSKCLFPFLSVFSRMRLFLITSCVMNCSLFNGPITSYLIPAKTMTALMSLQVTGGSPQGSKVVGLGLGDLDGPTEDPDDAAQKSCCGAHPVGRLIFTARLHFPSPASPNLDTHRLSCKNDAGDNSSHLGSRPPAVMLNDEEPSIFFRPKGKEGASIKGQYGHRYKLCIKIKTMRISFKICTSVRLLVLGIGGYGEAGNLA